VRAEKRILALLALASAAAGCGGRPGRSSLATTPGSPVENARVVILGIADETFEVAALGPLDGLGEEPPAAPLGHLPLAPSKFSPAS